MKKYFMKSQCARIILCNSRAVFWRCRTNHHRRHLFSPFGTHKTSRSTCRTSGCRVLSCFSIRSTSEPRQSTMFSPCFSINSSTSYKMVKFTSLVRGPLKSDIRRRSANLGSTMLEQGWTGYPAGPDYHLDIRHPARKPDPANPTLELCNGFLQ